MEEVRQIVELLEDAGKAVMIIKNVFKIQDEIPYFTISPNETGQFSYISKFHILISYKLTIYIVMCFYQGTN